MRERGQTDRNKNVNFIALCAWWECFIEEEERRAVFIFSTWSIYSLLNMHASVPEKNLEIFRGD